MRNRPTLHRMIAISSLPAMLALVAASARAQPAAVPGDQALERVYTPEEIALAMGEPTTLTLHLHNVAPEDVFDAIADRDGMWFHIMGRPDFNVSTDCERQPFWTGLQTVLQQTGYVLTNTASGYTLWAAGAPGRATDILAGPHIAAGPFFVELRDGQAPNPPPAQLQPLLAGGQPGGRLANTSVVGQVICDPKLQILSCRVGVAAAGDDTGHSLLDEGRMNRHIDQMHTTQIARFSIPLLQAAAGAKLLKTLSGTARLRVVAHCEQWEIPNPLQAGTVTRTFGPPDQPESLTLKAELINDGSALVLTGTFTVVNGSARDYGNSLQSTVRWRDAGGKSIAFGFRRAALPYDGQADYTFKATFASFRQGEQVAPPATLVVYVPTDIRNVDIPFAFHDLPLP